MPNGNLERPVNILTFAIDFASFYGADNERALGLREVINGLIKASSRNIFPLNRRELFEAPLPTDDFLVAADHCSSDYLVLTTSHKIFLREGSRLAAKLQAAYPAWDDERLLRAAREINIRQFLEILYEHFFSMRTGRQARRVGTFFQSALPSVSLLFCTAAYRIGCTVAGNVITRRGPGTTSLQSVRMQEVFFQEGTELNGTIELFVFCAIFQRAQEIGIFVNDAIRRLLFARVEEKTWFDLIILNIQRDLDAALPSCNDVKQRFTGRCARSFADSTSNATSPSRLSTACGGSTDDPEPWNGLMAEDHIPCGSMGSTMFAFWRDEFLCLRGGDMLFQEVPNPFLQQVPNDFSRLNRTFSEDSTMAPRILRNTEVIADKTGSPVWCSGKLS